MERYESDSLKECHSKSLWVRRTKTKTKTITKGWIRWIKKINQSCRKILHSLSLRSAPTCIVTIFDHRTVDMIRVDRANCPVDFCIWLRGLRNFLACLVGKGLGVKLVESYESYKWRKCLSTRRSKLSSAVDVVGICCRLSSVSWPNLLWKRSSSC